MKTLLEVLTLSANHLKQKGIANPRRQAEELIADALGVARLDLYMDFERPLQDKEMDLCRASLARRAKGEPQQYIRGQVDFFNCILKVNPSVLIPRQETEILVEKIAAELAEKDLKGKTLWDVCCGSGCIGISLKKRFPDLSVILSDISPQALETARENAQQNGVEVRFLQGDLLAPFAGQKCDYFVCNPPYVSESEYVDLEAEVKNFEPKLALVGGAAGIEFYARLAQELPALMVSGGKGWLEIGRGQGNAVKSLFSAAPWRNCRYEPDWSEHDRFFFLEIE